MSPLIRGKFGQRDQGSKTEYVQSQFRLWDLLNNDENVVDDVELAPTADHLMFVRYHKKDELALPTSFSNPFIASLVTSYARIALHKAADVVGTRAIYMDTDRWAQRELTTYK